MGVELIKNHEREVAVFSEDPTVLLEQNLFSFEQLRHHSCVARSSEIASKLGQLGFKDVSIIPPNFLPKFLSFKSVSKFKSEKYSIGFLSGEPDVFSAIVSGLAKRVGAEKLEVVMPPQLDLEQMNFDVALICDRWEQNSFFDSIAKASLAKRKILAIDLGFSKDFLNSGACFQTLSDAIEILIKDFEKNFLDQFVSFHYEKISTLCSEEATKPLWKNVWHKAEPVYLSSRRESSSSSLETFSSIRFRNPNFARSAVFEVSKLRKRFTRGRSITIWGEVVKGPYGGASQILKALSHELMSRGYKVHYNSYFESDGHIANSAFFDTKKLKTVLKRSKNCPGVVHRIDGPISIYRGTDRSIDETIFKLNQEVATATAFQSLYSWRECVRLGFNAVNPTIIRNACDPRLFYKKEKNKIYPNQKIKLISTSWSTNLKKGFEVYQYLDETLDFSRFEYEFVGRSPVEFKNIKMTPALPSPELGKKLRLADVFLFPSLFESASNALLEAITTGLPVIYADSGGNSEFARFSGISFTDKTQIPQILDQIVTDYESYSQVTSSKNISEITDAYLQALEL